MDRLTLLLSIIKRFGTEFVNPTGTFSNPIVIFFTTPFYALMFQLFGSHWCQRAHYFLLCCSIKWPPLLGTTQSSYPTLAVSPSTKGLWYHYHPYFFFFTSHLMGPFGVWWAASPQLNGDSQIHIPRFSLDWWRFCSVQSFPFSA